MRTLSWIVVLAACLCAASCGISGKTNGELPGKSKLEILDLAAAPTDTSAVITWHTPMQTVGTLNWGRVGTAASRPVSSTPAGQHQVVLTELLSDTKYWYQVTAATPLGERVTSLPDTFRTLVNQDLNDTTGPLIQDLQVMGITPTSATITWRTDDRTIGQVFYGFSATYGYSQADSASYGRTHAVTLTDLSENELYHFRVWAKNRARLTAYSDDATFHTGEQPFVEVNPETVSIVGNGEFEFGVNLRGAQNVAGLTFMLSFDPSVVEIISVVPSEWFRQTNGHLLIRESDDPARGRTKWDATWQVVFLNGSPVGTLANGGGEVAHIRARAKGTGASSPLRLVDTDLDGDGKPETRLLDHNRRDMPFHVRSGMVLKVQ
jgi:hypothetical protein